MSMTGYHASVSVAKRKPDAHSWLPQAVAVQWLCDVCCCRFKCSVKSRKTIMVHVYIPSFDTYLALTVCD